MNRFTKINPLLGLIAAAVTASVAAVATPQTGTAKFVKVQGTVTVDSNPAKTGEFAKPGSIVATAEKSLARLDIGKNGPDLLIDENSKVSIDDLTYDDSGSETVISTKLGAKQGSFSGRVNRMSAQSTYTVSTPTTTAAIRGTVYTATQAGVVYVFEGSVDVIWTDPSTGRPANFNVSAGQMFDPSIPGVVEIPPGTKAPFGSENVFDGDLPIPVGPLTFISPVSGSRKTK
jgi:FecR protein